MFNSVARFSLLQAVYNESAVDEQGAGVPTQVGAINSFEKYR